MREPGFYRVKLYGRWKVIEYTDPATWRGGWQVDRTDPQPWEDRNFDAIDEQRITMPDEA